MKKTNSLGIVALVLCTILCAGCTSPGSNLAGTYDVENNQNLTLKLYDDNTFYCRGYWCEISGDYFVKGNTIYFETYFETFTAEINGNTLTEPDGVVWVRQ